MTNTAHPSHMPPAYANRSALNKNWGRAVEFAFCEQCDWHYLLPQGMLPCDCPHCYQRALTALEPYQQQLNQPPELFLPFSLAPEILAERIQAFVDSIPFAPPDLQPSELQKRLQPVYLPLWLVDTHLEATFGGEVGFDYDVVSHQERLREGRWQTEQVTQNRIRWEARVGRLSRHYDNIPAPALEESDYFKPLIETAQLSASQPYSPQALAGALVRLPTRSPSNAFKAAFPRIQQIAAQECQQAAQAQHIREFAWKLTSQTLNWTLYLLPLYSTYYLDDEQQAQPVLLQGQSGQLSGKRRASMKQAQRTSLFMIALALAIALLSLLALRIAPTWMNAAIVGLSLATILGLLALYPVVRVWQFNHKKVA